MQDAQQLIGQGIYLSAGESLSHPERKIYKTLKSIDLDHLFLETDMAEIGIEKVYDAAAKALDLDIDALKLKIMDNFMRVFKANFDSAIQQS
jgi:TatD DNase family protein